MFSRHPVHNNNDIAATDRFVGVWSKLLISLAAALDAYLLACVFLRATLYVSTNGNEGWNAGHSLRLFQGGKLYLDHESLLMNNYPPVSFILTHIVMHIVPDPIFAGRVIASAAFIAIPILLFKMLRNIGCLAWHAAFAACLFLTSMLVTFPYYVAVNDPQMLAFAFLLGGACLATRPRPSLYDMAFAASLLSLAFFTKQNSIALILIW